MIRVKCPQCGKELHVDDKYAGKTGNCLHCKQKIKVPSGNVWRELGDKELSGESAFAEYYAVKSDPESRSTSTDTALVIGWILFASTLLSAVFGGLPAVVFLILVCAGFILYDAPRQGASLGTTVAYTIGCIALWIVAFPLYLIKRDSIDEETVNIPTARVAVYSVLLIGSVVALFFARESYMERTGNTPKFSILSTPILDGPLFNVNQSGPATLAEFGRLSNGMSYRQAVNIIGAEGVLISSNYIEGVPGIMESIDTRMYMWDGRGSAGANMNAMFQNDRMMSKAQLGLK